MGRLDVEVGPHFQDKLAAVVRIQKPRVMIETGLETGFGAEFYLQAMDSVGVGHLYSIDPKPHWKYDAKPIVHPRFTLIKERSQDVLHRLFRDTGPWDLFLHDSDHSYECQTFEYETAWNYVRPGGIIASDDPFWGPHFAWDHFLKRHKITERRIIGNAQWVYRP